MRRIAYTADYPTAPKAWNGTSRTDQGTSTIKVSQKAWRGKIQDFLKTKNGKREIDLHSSVAAMLKDFIGERNQGLLFQSRNGKPLSQSNILRRSLHPILVKLNQPRRYVPSVRQDQT